MLREALYLINDGICDAEGVDRAVRYGFGFRFIACGPMLQKEMSGWDTNYFVGSALYPSLYKNDEPPRFLRELVEKNRLGMKTKQGFWEWDDEGSPGESAHRKALQAGMQILKDDKPSSTGAADSSGARARAGLDAEETHGFPLSFPPCGCGEPKASAAPPPRDVPRTFRPIAPAANPGRGAPFLLLAVIRARYYFGGKTCRSPGNRAPRNPNRRKEASVTTQSSESASLAHVPAYIGERSRQALEAGLVLEKQVSKSGLLSTWYVGSEAQIRAARLIRLPEPFVFPSRVGARRVSALHVFSPAAPRAELKCTLVKLAEDRFRVAIVNEIMPVAWRSLSSKIQVYKYCELKEGGNSGPATVYVGPFPALQAAGIAPAEAERETLSDADDQDRSIRGSRSRSRTVAIASSSITRPRRKPGRRMKSAAVPISARPSNTRTGCAKWSRPASE